MGALCAGPYYIGPVASAVMGPTRPNLRDYEPLPVDRAPGVSIILPARNEAANIERCVKSILASEYPGFELIVVDDRSDDDTAAIAERIAAGDERVTVIRGAELPKGWFGKPWACWQGFQVAKGSLLLFTDADTVHGPLLLPLAVAAIEKARADMVTVMPHQEMIGFWERVAQPFFFLLLGLRYGTLDRMNANRNPRDAIANGQFILVTRDSYGWVGGHKKVQNTIIEDLMLAKRYIEGGKKVLFALADQDMTTRMYTSLGQLVEGWSKNFFMGTMETTGSKALAYIAAILALFLPAVFLLPLLALPAGLWLYYERFDFGEGLIGFGAAGLVGATLLIGTILRASKAPWIYGIFHPLGALVQIRVMLRAVRRGAGRLVWKGRTYSQ